MKINQVERTQSKIRIAISGPAGSGKSYSSLLLAKGLVSKLNNVVVIDTESGSANLYADLGDYQVIGMDTPHSPERYIQAIDIALSSGATCIIIDSLSHCWEYLLQYHSTLTGNSFTNWGIVKPRMKKLTEKILQSNAHFICTLRTKTDYVLNHNDKGKLVPQKVGLKSIQVDGLDYEFTILFELDIQNNATCSKDRTQLFTDKQAFLITQRTGEEISSWCKSGVNIDDVKTKINDTKSLEQLTEVYNAYKPFYEELKDEFQSKRKLLQLNYSNIQKNSNNGIYKH